VCFTVDLDLIFPLGAIQGLIAESERGSVAESEHVEYVLEGEKPSSDRLPLRASMTSENGVIHTRINLPELDSNVLTKVWFESPFTFFCHPVAVN
jgi:hypothetical protein